MTKTKDFEITEVALDYPNIQPHELALQIGACRATAQRADIENWFYATYEHPREIPPLKMQVQGGKATLSQDFSFPASISGFLRKAPKLDLDLGTAYPYALSIQGGAFEGDFDLGAVPLEKLKIESGAGKLTVNFSERNPVTMQEVSVESGAMKLEMYNLVNANFREMKIEGGASSYTFDFGGILEHNANVKLETGVASVRIVVPPTTAAHINVRTTMGSVSADAAFSKQAGAYWTQAALDQKKPLLTIDAEVAVGSLKLESA